MADHRVLVVNDRPPGSGSGVEVHVARLVAGLRAAGDAVELFAGEITHEGARRALDVWDPAARRRLAARAEAFRPDVVHHHHVVRELSASVLGVPRGTPQVLTVHDFRLLGDPDGARGALGVAKRLKAMLDRAVARRRVDVVIAVSEPLRDALVAAGFRDVRVVPPFADPPAVEPAPPSRSTAVAFAGRLAPDKGADVLARAWHRVLERRPDARLLVAGAGPLTLAFHALPATEILGALDADDVQHTFGRARVVVVPSVPGLRREGTPTVAIEAALAGRPLVVSDDPGLVAFADATGGAVVVPAGDPVALADALVRLLADDELADALGSQNAVQARKEHATDVGVAAVREIYAEARRR